LRSLMPSLADGLAMRPAPREMNAALDLAGAGPAPRAGVFSGAHRARAGRAADGRIAARLQRMARQVVRGEIGVDPRRVPAGKRIDLDAPVLRLLDQREFAARRGLVALAAGDPGIEAVERRVERLDLALPAAEIGIVAPQR